MIIYKTTNRINNKIYIGKSIKNNPLYKGSGTLIKRALSKYGNENFDKEILITCKDLNTLNYLEKFFISIFDSQNKDIGYNISSGGDGGNIIENMNNKQKIYEKRSKSIDKWRKSISKERKEEIDKKISKSTEKIALQRGINISNAKSKYELVGPKAPRKRKSPILMPLEHREKISNSLKGNSPTNKVRVVIDNIEYSSLIEASEKTGISLSTMRNRLKSKNYPSYYRL